MLRLAAGEMRSQITARRTSDRGSPKLRAGMLYILYCLSYFNTFGCAEVSCFWC